MCLTERVSLSDSRIVNVGWHHLAAHRLHEGIGFGPEATHTVGTSSLANLKTEPLSVERHPTFVIPMREVNQAIFDYRFPGSDMKKSKTLMFRLTQPARQAKHWWRTRER